MAYSVLKGASYTLVHAPDMILHGGTTQTTERHYNPESEYLKKLPEHIRSFEETVKYLPNQVYIGNERPEKLRQVEKPWYENPLEGGSREGKLGEIMPQDEFIGLIKIVDVFDLVSLSKEFTDMIKAKLQAHPII